MQEGGFHPASEIAIKTLAPLPFSPFTHSPGEDWPRRAIRLANRANGVRG
jgi:hypothetical protein